MFLVSGFCPLPFCMFEFIHRVCGGIAVKTGRLADQQEALHRHFLLLISFLPLPLL